MPLSSLHQNKRACACAHPHTQMLVYTVTRMCQGLYAKVYIGMHDCVSGIQLFWQSPGHSFDDFHFKGEVFSVSLIRFTRSFLFSFSLSRLSAKRTEALAANSEACVLNGLTRGRSADEVVVCISVTANRQRRAAAFAAAILVAP